MKIKIGEFVLGISIVLLFLVHYFGFLDQSMIFSGILVTLVCAFIGLVWKEQALDEREEFIRTKTDRYLFLLTLSLISLSIIYKTFNHINYFEELLLLVILSIIKLFLSRFISKVH